VPTPAKSDKSAQDKDTQKSGPLPPHRPKAGKMPDSEEKEGCLKEPRSFKNARIDVRLGYGSQPIAYILTIRKDRYPEAYEAFEKELER
jgi:hypothetical protein